MSTVAQRPPISLEEMLAPASGAKASRLEVFAVVNLGILEFLSSGLMTTEEATERFYNAANCLYVRRRLKHATCDEVMSRGVQLADVLDILPVAEAHREFASELEEMRRLCRQLLSRTSRTKGTPAK